MSITIDGLAADWEAAKIEETRATARRIDAEQALVNLLGTKTEGAQTHRGERYKVTLTGVVNRRFDAAALEALRGAIPAALFDQAVRYKPEPINAGLVYLRNNEPETYAVLAQALTVAPGKPGVRVEAVMREAA